MQVLIIASKQSQDGQRDALIIQNYSVIKLYMFRASSLPIIRNFLPIFGTGKFHAGFDYRFQAESGWPTRRTNYPKLFCYKTLHVSGIFSAHHQEFSTYIRRW